MPTYSFRCALCGGTMDVFRSISDHSRCPRPLFCCGAQAERYFPPTGRVNALDNVLAGDRHYIGLQAQDGTDISSRSKHREYMHRHGLTTADDYTETWAKAAKEREAYRRGESGKGAITRDDIARAFARHYGG
jgi:putative FmdB family regulatory protein